MRSRITRGRGRSSFYKAGIREKSLAVFGPHGGALPNAAASLTLSPGLGEPFWWNKLTKRFFECLPRFIRFMFTSRVSKPFGLAFNLAGFALAFGGAWFHGS